MKKLLFLLLCIGLVFNVSSYAKDSFKGSLIELTTLDDDPTSVTSDGVNVSDFDKVAFWVTYDEAEVGGGVSGTVTLEVSYDDSTYLSASFYDFAGGSTLQTSEVISADGSYYFWWNRDLNVKYARVKIVGTNTDVDDIIDVTVNFTSQK